MMRAREAAEAYRDLCTCYRIGKQPSESLFKRIKRAREFLRQKPGGDAVSDRDTEALVTRAYNSLTDGLVPPEETLRILRDLIARVTSVPCPRGCGTKGGIKAEGGPCDLCNDGHTNTGRVSRECAEGLVLAEWSRIYEHRHGATDSPREQLTEYLKGYRDGRQRAAAHLFAEALRREAERRA